MSVRSTLLSSTMLSGIAGGLLLATVTAKAADLQPVIPAPVYKAPYAVYDPFAPAVDGTNAKFIALGGSYANRSLYGAGGSLSIPLGGSSAHNSTASLVASTIAERGRSARTFSGVTPREAWPAFIWHTPTGTSSVASM